MVKPCKTYANTGENTMKAIETHVLKHLRAHERLPGCHIDLRGFQASAKADVLLKISPHTAQWLGNVKHPYGLMSAGFNNRISASAICYK